jgi:hypothetical protein
MIMGRHYTIPRRMQELSAFPVHFFSAGVWGRCCSLRACGGAAAPCGRVGALLLPAGVWKRKRGRFPAPRCHFFSDRMISATRCSRSFLKLFCCSRLCQWMNHMSPSTTAAHTAVGMTMPKVKEVIFLIMGTHTPGKAMMQVLSSLPALFFSLKISVDRGPVWCTVPP